MGSGTGVVTTGDTAEVMNGVDPSQLPDNPLKKKPTAAPDLTDPMVLLAKQNAARALAAKRGLGSTFLTTPQLGTGNQLGGYLGGS